MGARIDPRSHRRAALFASVIFTVATAIAACSSESNPKPPDTNFTTSSGSSSTTSATGTGGAGGGSTTTATGTSSATGAGGAGGGGTGGTGGAPPNCDGPNGCYSCPPKTGNQFLNACTSAQCSPFDNVARLPLYNNGNLPAIP